MNKEVAEVPAEQPAWDREPDPCWSCGGEAEARDDIYVRCLDTKNINCEVMNHSYSRKTWNTRALSTTTAAQPEYVSERTKLIREQQRNPASEVTAVMVSASISDQAQRAARHLCGYHDYITNADGRRMLFAEIAAIIEAELAHKGEDAIATLRERFIRPEHELTPEFQKAKSMAGTRAKPWRCSKCGEYAVVNNVCGNCERDERLRYGDFERTMTTYEWTIIQANLGDSIK